MKHLILLYFLIFSTSLSFAQHVSFSKNTTPTWQECIQMFEAMDDSSDIAELLTIGKGDSGKPIHLFIISKDRNFFPEHFDREKSVVFINNAIHPGEPDGVDACLMFCREILNEKNDLHYLLDSVIFCIIPIYNVDGALMRNGYSRSNQNGPELYGFRGNAKNLDLNRDFMKCDSRNAEAFTRAFRRCDPEILIDTHVSNGADYPYVMTLISTQSDKLGELQGSYMRKKMVPHLFDNMKEAGFEMCPYVNHMGRTPDSGIADFLETARYSTGYAALFQTMGFTTETHMLKPYPQRVESTYHFIVELSKYVYAHNKEIIALKKEALQKFLKQEKYTFNFRLDTTVSDKFRFKGYEGVTEPALVGNGERLRYDRSRPYEKDIKYFNKYTPEKEVQIPEYYVIPQAWSEVTDRLKWNNVWMKEIMHDTTMAVNCYLIGDVKTASSAYEGHFVHQKYNIRSEKCKVHLFKGDFLVPVRQPAIRYLMESLEPESSESFFKWNFFDGVLQQKEWFSDYVFEEKAQEILEENPELKRKFEEELKANEEMKEHWMQLYWIYRHSPYFEQSAFRYPVYRLN